MSTPSTVPEGSSPPLPPPAQWAPQRKSRFALVLIIALGMAAAVIVAIAFDLPPFVRNPTTDDAYVRGRTTIIAPEVSGYVTKVLVDDYAQVHAGDLLLEIDTKSYQTRVDQTQAALALQVAQLSNNDQALASARATLGGKVAALGSARVQNERSDSDYQRAQALVGDGSISARERDQDHATFQQAVAALSQAEADVNIAKANIRAIEVQREALSAQVQGARAQVESATVDIGHTRIVAPEDGQLSEVGVHLGQFVTNGTQLFSLVPTIRWVIASYKEAQTQQVRVGQPASFTVDALGGARLDGFVERISPAAESEFAVIKPDNGTGNFVKVPQRLGVRIGIKPGQPLAARLRPGMSVEAVVDVSAADMHPPEISPHPAAP